MQDHKKKRFFCFGYGYTADYLGHALQEENSGWTLGGTTRHEERRRALMERRIRARIFSDEYPVSDPETLFSRFTHLLISTPPDDNGDPVFNLHAKDFAHLPNLQWVGYLSSTSVYGNRDGGHVDENSEIRPTSKRGSRRALAERQWLSLYQQYGVPVHIFRVSGIYGPGRSALDSIRAGVARRIEKPGHKFNRIHVDDIVQTIRASFSNPNPGAVYNLADDYPAASYDVIGEACEMLGISAPPIIPFDQADLAPIALSFYNDNKHVLNNRIKQELGVDLKYPDYKSGLKGCLQAEENFLSDPKNSIAS